MRIAVLGAGALGSVIGGLLSLAGRQVALWDTDAAHIAAVRAEGLRLDLAGTEHRPALDACHPSEAGPADLVILTTKTLHTAPALAGIAPVIAAGAHVLTLQNGLGNAEAVARAVPRDRVLYGCTMLPGRRLGPGHVTSAGEGGVTFSHLTPAGTEFAKALALTHPRITLTYDAEGTDRAVWTKAALNCAMNSVLALTGGTVATLARDAQAQALARSIAAEVIDTARAQGIDVDLAPWSRR